MECVFALAFFLCVEGAFGYMCVGKNKFRLQYPGYGVLSNEFGRTVTNPFLKDDRFFSARKKKTAWQRGRIGIFYAV